MIMEKRLIILAVIFTLVNWITAFGQIPSQSWVVEGNMGADFSSNEFDHSQFGRTTYGRYQNFSFNPIIGRAIQDNLVTGMSLDYSYQEGQGDPFVDFEGKTFTESHQYSIAPFIRKYHFLNEKIALSGEVRGGYTGGEIKDKFFLILAPGESQSINSRYRTDGFNLALRSGLSYFFTPTFALNASMEAFRYGTNWTKYGDFPTYEKKTEINVAGGLDAFDLGVTFFLNRKTEIPLSNP
jgi:hypothetical protein